jgi:hypothetical protein
MTTRNFSDLIANENTNLTATAIGDYLLIYDASEPLDVNKIKVVSIADLMKLTTETARQPIVTEQAAGDLFYASAAGVLARLAKGTANQVLKMNSGATAPEWGENRFIGARVVSSAQLINIGTWTTISFSTEVFDTDGMFNAGTPTVINIVTSGYYLVGYFNTWQIDNVGVREVHINIDTAPFLFGSQPTTPGITCSMSGSYLIYLTAGQSINMTVWHNSNANITVSGRLWVTRVGSE